MSMFTQPSVVPPTLLPVDHKALSRYLRSRQLAALRHLYEYKTLAVTQQIEEHAASQRGRHGRARRRRGSTPPLDPRDLEAEEIEDDLEVRKKMRYDPLDEETEGLVPDDDALADEAGSEAESSGAATRRAAAAAGRQERQQAARDRADDDDKVDPAHVYDYAFDLAPDASSDAYYHGPHPPPPARVVHAVLRATRKKPFVDPAGLSTPQLEALTRDMWASEGHGLSVFFGEGDGGRRRAEQPLSRDQDRYQRELHAEAADEWEQGVIAGFAAACDERIGRSLARRPMTAREMQAQAQVQAAQVEAQQRQQQQQQQHGASGQPPHSAPPPQPGSSQHTVPGPTGYTVPPQLSPFAERDRFGAVGAWRWYASFALRSPHVPARF
ncbi:hypothetical protein JCM3770_003762 [Rhodotorula araucariae]